MAQQKFKVGDFVRAAKSVTGEVTKAREQSNGWVYEVRMDRNAAALPTYLESQLTAIPRTERVL